MLLRLVGKARGALAGVLLGRVLAFAFGRLPFGVLALRKLHRLVDHLRRLGDRMLLVTHVPQAEIVVAIGRLDHIGLGIELHPHLAEVVAEQVADLARDRRVVDAVAPFGEHRPALPHPGVAVHEIGVDQAPRQASEEGGGDHAAGGRGDMERLPQAGEAGKVAHRQMLDAGVLDQRDDRHLHRLEAAKREAPAGMAVMGADMGKCCPENGLRLVAPEAGEGRRHADQAFAVARPPARRLGGAGGGLADRHAHAEQGGDEGLHLALHVGEDHLAGLAAEPALGFRMAGDEEFAPPLDLGAGAPHAGQQPAFERVERQPRQQRVHAVEHACRRLRRQPGEAGDDGEPAPEGGGVAEAVGDPFRRDRQTFRRPAAGTDRQRRDQVRHLDRRFGADRERHPRPVQLVCPDHRLAVAGVAQLGDRAKPGGGIGRGKGLGDQRGGFGRRVRLVDKFQETGLRGGQRFLGLRYTRRSLPRGRRACRGRR